MLLDLAPVSLWIKSNFLLLAELCLVVGLMALAALAKPPRWLQSLWRRWRQLASRRAASLLFPAVLAVSLRLLLLPWAGVPYPGSARDEFSYLLAADTFASGRLTNPPHPQFRHFESPHILFEPTYASKYPPGQGLALALGQVLGHPWIGVLLSVAGMIVAAGWAMRAWLPAPYALLGATLLALRMGVMSYWANSYWGGAVAAIGGALLIGALPRLVKKPTAFAGAMLGFGLGTLAISRPFEGFIFSAIVLLLWAYPVFGGGWRQIRSLRPAIAGGAASLGIVLLWLGIFQAAVTGDPLKAPYTAWRDSYSRFETFIWETPVENYHSVNEAYGRFMNWVIESHEEYRSPIQRLARVVGQFVAFFWGPMLTLFLVLAVPWIFKDFRMRLLLIAIALAVLTIVLVVDLWTFSHYFGPLTVALVIAGVQALRIVVAAARRRFGGPRPGYVMLLLGLPAVLLALNLVGLFLRNTDRLWTTPTYFTGWCCFSFPSERAHVEQSLNTREGRHLVFVRHPPEGFWGAEWVYNGASIDSGKIVWAREVSPEADCALRRYYSDRQVWLTYVHERPARLTPYPAPGCKIPGGE